MGFCFSKPDKKQVLIENRELVDSNARLLAVCVELGAETALKDKIERVSNAVRFMTPTAKAGANQIDKKINALAGDLKIALNKGDRGLLQAEDILNDLNVAVAERNAY